VYRVPNIAVLLLVAVVLAAPMAIAQEADDTDAAPGQGKPVEVSYDGGFKLETRDRTFLLLINAGLQFRYTYMDYDQEIRYNDENYSNFYVRRARLMLRGYAFDPRFSYLIHIQLEPTRTVNAHDLWLSYAFSDLVNLGVGRNKIAYGLGMLNSGWGLEFVDRSLMFGETDIDNPGADGGPAYPGGGTERFALYWQAPETGFATGGMTLYRSQGIQLSGQRGSPTTSTFEYQLGVWNGRGTTGFSNDGDDMLYALRVGYHPWGWLDWFRQGDGVGTPFFKLGMLASAYHNASETAGGYVEHGYNLAAMGRYRGFSTDVEWGVEHFDYDAFTEDFDREGWRICAGYFVGPAAWEIVARYAQIERLKNPSYQSSIDSGLGVAQVKNGNGGYEFGIEKKISELTVGANWFLGNWHQHSVKMDMSRMVRDFAADTDAVVDGEPTPIEQAPTQVDYRIRVMVQMFF
jgi:hypothetical protein